MVVLLAKGRACGAGFHVITLARLSEDDQTADFLGVTHPGSTRRGRLT